MRDPAENTIEHRGFRIEIHRDDDSGDVSEALQGGDVWLYAWHRRYTFGEKPPAWATEAMEEGTLHEAILAKHPGAAILPVFMFEHSGIALSTGAFGCPWDSGQLGVIFTTEVFPEADGAERFLRAVVAEMDNRVRGNVWGYVVKTPEGEDLDSCWGYVGGSEDSGLLDAARETIDHEIKRRETGDRLVAEAFAL